MATWLGCWGYISQSLALNSCLKFSWIFWRPEKVYIYTILNRRILFNGFQHFCWVLVSKLIFLMVPRNLGTMIQFDWSFCYHQVLLLAELFQFTQVKKVDVLFFPTKTSIISAKIYGKQCYFPAYTTDFISFHPFSLKHVPMFPSTFSVNLGPFNQKPHGGHAMITSLNAMRICTTSSNGKLLVFPTLRHLLEQFFEGSEVVFNG